ncbi:uncharacterized protein Z520_07457 [Fonsecaea multimorphosa CBS 102226]|uniref:Spindle pole body-associated protein cut12 domain-containing protein n=1 Tax=Fonsecaea multimorphosa CBS 102226 TaxID=1442371 RepID=A0A0D2KJH3_9EURO|nr:uncharacterized protein Z520_07457 [Fonsecaea multimorphosa CBS 102226]KIX96738.1 hypothetical protein Z520_07457 [Fonsecaea multimorphosa CBS 102226]OAL22419.1 hypothetical protein AYO22_06976 [Fonsecaea multimorphosa]
MPSEDTILEGPITPAPVFAYRALRSIFFASPESSPEHDANKENLVPAYPPSSPKRKHSTGNSPQTSPSPSQKRKRESDNTNNGGGGTILSPTKGILRTPGLATPRAKYLKDINVKFKSVSPEGPKLAPPTLRCSKPTNNPAASPTKKKSTPVLQDPLLQDEELLLGNRPTTASVPPSSPCVLSRASIEAYLAQTEKEMKKLVRYGQKMREYARKKDAENQELKSMIEQLRRENERLKRGDADSSASESHRGASGDVPQVVRGQLRDKDEEKQRRVSVGIVTGTNNASPALRDKPRGYVREEVDRVETTVRSQRSEKASKDQRYTSLSSTGTAERSDRVCDPARPSGPSCSAPSDHPPSIKRSLSTSTSQRRASAATSTLVSTTRPSDLPNNPPPSAEADPAAITTSIRSASAGTIAARPSITRLPPERVAAARHRLRRRTEARKANVPVVEVVLTWDKRGEGDGKGHAGNERQLLGTGTVKAQEPAKQLEEPSEVDWANL